MVHSPVMPISRRSPIAFGVLLATASAISFGITTPLIGRFGARLGPLTTAALLYAGATILSIAVRPLAASSGRALTRAAIPRLLLVALFGSALAPALLVWGLSRAGATGSSLMLNFEAIFTMLLARLVYREHVGRRVVFAITAMLVGGILVGFDATSRFGTLQIMGLVAVLGATASWAMDNTLARALAEENPLEIIAAKGALGAA